jgi:hypothetical protein
VSDLGFVDRSVGKSRKIKLCVVEMIKEAVSVCGTARVVMSQTYS